MKVKMVPHKDVLKNGVSGIHTIVRAWFKHLPAFGVELVPNKSDDFDLLAVHAGMVENLPANVPVAAHIHGAYWTSDYAASLWEWEANKNVIESCRKSSIITVPSLWVAEAFQRDMRLTPEVVPHGIDWQDWQHEEDGGYVIAYAKNRAYNDVCDPTFITQLARRFPQVRFMATFAPKDVPPNVKVTGVLPNDEMKKWIQRASLVISPIKETFGVLTLEAMASGVPVLGYAHGGNLELIEHGITGYLAVPRNVDDLAQGLDWCLQHRQELGVNARESVKKWTWEAACQKLTSVYEKAMQVEPPTVAVVIPSYKYAEKVSHAIESALNQTYKQVTEIVVVDDGSRDDGATEKVVGQYAERDSRVRYIHQDNAGVACARNHGISQVSAKYVVCLDADDTLEPEFVRACIEPLENDRSLGISYTALLQVHPDGHTAISQWPHKFDPDAQFARQNQIPTACLFRRAAWERVGGLRQRYAPNGCGSEDADFWTRILACGYGAVQCTEAPLFRYSVGTGYVSGNKDYHEVDWLALHPWAKDKQYPFACIATPANKRSHPVRQYDEPIVSVVIPVGPGHKTHVFDALDSLESQTLRKWEVIVVDDTGNPDEPWAFDGNPNALSAYPYVRLIATPGKKGAGYARNRGVAAARATLVVFLDADDMLCSPDALMLLCDAWNKSGNIIYSDYLAKAVVDEQEAEKLKKRGALVNWDQKSGMVMYRGHTADYDCERALRQPADPLYIWNLITSLVPKAWHDEIGGFDEEMESWEDWDYWLRMARAGKCFVRVIEPLVCYRFYTGNRRETGIQVHKNLLQYLLKKYEGTATMPCGCSKNKKVMSVAQPTAMQQQAAAGDDNFIRVRYTSPNRGDHRVVGMAVVAKEILPGAMIPTQGGWKFDYRRHSGGDEFDVFRGDVDLQPHLFSPIQQAAATGDFAVNQPPQEPLPLPGDGQPGPFDPQAVAGVTAEIAVQLRGLNVDSPDCLVDLGEDGLMKLEGMTERRARTILASAAKMKGADA